MLHGWGRTSPVVSRALTVDADQVAEAIRSAGPRGLVARGLGRSYGDAAQNAGGTVLLPIPGETRMDGDNVVVSAGTSLHDLMRYLLPRGRFLPVTPGTRYVTVGGAIACDVHGKSHHRVGHLRGERRLRRPGHPRRRDPPDRPHGRPRAVLGDGRWDGPDRRPAACHAAHRSRSRPAGSASTPSGSATSGSLTAAMRESDDAWTYSVAWVDTVSRGRALGRSVLSRGEHAHLGDLDGRRARTPYPLPGEPRLSAPPRAPDGLVSRASVRAFNGLWFHKAPRHREGELQTLAAFFHPLDGVGDWNRLYGPSGFVQYQLVVPDAAEEVVHDAVRRLAAGGHASFLAVLKRFGPANDGLLSFPVAGWTLALDLPARPGLASVLDDARRAGGRGGGPGLPRQGRPVVRPDVRRDVSPGRRVRTGARPGGPGPYPRLRPGPTSRAVTLGMDP